MGTVKKGAILLSLLVAILFGGTGFASAQPTTTPVAPPTTASSAPSPTAAVPTTSAPATLDVPEYNVDAPNEFDKEYAACKEALGGDVGNQLAGIITGALNLGSDPCAIYSGVQHPSDAFETISSEISAAIWGDPVGDFIKGVMEANLKAFTDVMAYWLKVKGGLTDSTGYINGIRFMVTDIQLFALAMGIGVGALRIAIARRHAVSEGADETARAMFRTIFAIASLPFIVAGLHTISDEFSIWVIEQASGGNINAQIKAIAYIDEEALGLGPILCLILAAIGLFGSFVQLIALFIREAILILAVALAPIAASASVTGSGRQTWSSMISFTVAALLFKPVASLIYALAFWAAASDYTNDAIAGAVLLVCAGMSMPVLVRVIAPTVATISAGGSQIAGAAAGLAGAVGTGAALASGARSLGRQGMAAGGGGRGGGGGGAGGSGPAASGAVAGPGSNGSRPSSGTSAGPPGSGGGSAGPPGSGGGPSGSRNGTAAGTRSGLAGRAVGRAASLGVTGLGGAARATAMPARMLSGTANFTEGMIANGQVPR